MVNLPVSYHQDLAGSGFFFFFFPSKFIDVKIEVYLNGFGPSQPQVERRTDCSLDIFTGRTKHLLRLFHVIATLLSPPSVEAAGEVDPDLFLYPEC